MPNKILMFKELVFQGRNRMAINQNTLKDIYEYVIFAQ